MALRGIDVSSHQEGLDVAAIEADFVIVKATEGTDYVNPLMSEQAESALASGKLLGFYHYANGGDVYAEAAFFLEKVRTWAGRAILCLDWESGGNDRFTYHCQWTHPFLKCVAESTGCTPLLYCSASVRGANDVGYPMWVAQYDGYEPTGYQDSPWNEGAYECAIRQYSSSGRLDGYGGNLDLNKAYIGRDTWREWASCTDPESDVNDGGETARESFVQALLAHVGESDEEFNDWALLPHGTPWCATFQGYVGIHEMGFDWQRSASAADFCLQFERVPDADARRGDLVFFGWDGIQEVYFRASSHVACVTGFDHSTGIFTTVDGNSTGNMVRENEYDNYASYFTAFFRPDFPEVRQRIEKTEDEEMIFTFQPEGDEVCYLYDGNNIHTMDEIDELMAWRKAYRAVFGRELTHMNDACPEFCAKSSPYHRRFADVLRHDDPGIPSFH